MQCSFIYKVFTNIYVCPRLILRLFDDVNSDLIQILQGETVNIL